MEIRKGFKLFEMREDQKLFPLFIGKNTEIPIETGKQIAFYKKEN